MDKDPARPHYRDIDNTLRRCLASSSFDNETESEDDLNEYSIISFFPRQDDEAQQPFSNYSNDEETTHDDDDLPSGGSPVYMPPSGSSEVYSEGGYHGDSHPGGRDHPQGNYPLENYHEGSNPGSSFTQGNAYEYYPPQGNYESASYSDTQVFSTESGRQGSSDVVPYPYTLFELQEEEEREGSEGEGM